MQNTTWTVGHFYRFDYTVPLPFDNTFDRTSVTIWLRKNVGSESIDWQWDYNLDDRDNRTVDFSFRQPEHATLFALKWR